MKAYTRGISLTGLAIAVLLVAMTNCTRTTERRLASNRTVLQGVLHGEIEGLEPVSTYSGILPSIYEPLYQYTFLSDSYQVEPLLAESMPQLSPDRLTVTIPVKKGIFFADDPCFKESQGKGREVTAQDFVYSLKRIAIPSLRSMAWWALDDKVVGINAFRDKFKGAQGKERMISLLEEPVEGLVALDRYTIQIRLKRPYPQLVYALALNMTSVVPKEAIAEYGDEEGFVRSHPVGTGPYILDKWERNRGLVLKRNPNYHPDFYPDRAHASPAFQSEEWLSDAGKRLPMIDEIQYRIIKEEWTRWLEFQKGTIDILNVPKDAYNQVFGTGGNHLELSPEMKAKGIHLYTTSSTAMVFLSINMNDPILGKNKALRQAISSAIDREAWIKTFTNGTGKKMTFSLPLGTLGRRDNAGPKYDYHLARARELMKAAGYPDGNGLPVLEVDFGDPSTTRRQFSEFLSQQLGQIGIKIQPAFTSGAAFEEKRKKGRTQILYDGRGWTIRTPRTLTSSFTARTDPRDRTPPTSTIRSTTDSMKRWPFSSTALNAKP